MVKAIYTGLSLSQTNQLQSALKATAG